MDNTDLKNELEELRNQLDELKKQRQAEQVSTAENSGKMAHETADEQEPCSDTKPELAAENIISSLTSESSEELVSQFKGLLESIDNDIKDTKPTTLLVVFALGVIVGRL